MTHEDPEHPGHYTEARSRLHGRIIKHALKGTVPSEGRPFALFVAGGPTSGKSTLIHALQVAGVIPKRGAGVINKMPFSQLPEYARVHDARHPEKTNLLVDEYYDLMAGIVDAAIARRVPIVIEDHCEASSRINPLLFKLKAAGYETGMIGMTVDPAAYFESEEGRCRTQRKQADHPWALALHRALAWNWEEYAPSCTVALLCRRSPGAGIETVARCELGGRINILDRDAYAEFRQWKNANIRATRQSDVFPAFTGELSLGERSAMAPVRRSGAQGRREAVPEDAAPASFRERVKAFARETSGRDRQG